MMFGFGLLGWVRGDACSVFRWLAGASVRKFYRGGSGEADHYNSKNKFGVCSVFLTVII